MNRLRLLPLIALFSLLACTIPVTEQTATPALQLPAFTPTPQPTEETQPSAIPPTDMPLPPTETEAVQPTETTIPDTAEPQSTEPPAIEPTAESTATSLPPTQTATPQPTETQIPDTPTPQPTDTPISDTPTPQPTKTPSPAAGFACFSTEDGGLACVSAAGDWITPPDNGTIVGITACPDQIVILGDELLLFDGTQFTPQDAPFLPTYISCAEDDAALWIASDDALAVYVDGSWTSHAGAPTTPIRSLAAVDEDEAWTSSALAVDRLEDSEWTTYKALDGFDDTYLFEEVVTAGDGNVWAVATNTIFRFSGRRWINPFREPWPPLSTIAFDFTAPAIGTLYDGVLGSVDFGSPISALSYDDDGRLHIGSPIGVTIDDIVYTPATSSLTHPHVTQIAIVGAPMYAVQTKQNSTIKGRIVDADWNGVANETVMLCDQPPRRFYATIPCPSSFTTTTGGDGTFRFDTVPLNTYHIVYTIDGEWVGWPEGITVRDGETVDVGRLSRE